MKKMNHEKFNTVNYYNSYGVETSCSSLINIERLDMPTERPIIGIEDYSEVLDKGPNTEAH